MNKHQNIKIFALLVCSLLTFSTSIKAQSGGDSMVPVINFNFSCTPDETIKGKMLLQWSVSSEEGLNHFVLERSTDGVSFNDAAIIFSNGGTEGAGQYKFRDTKPATTSGKLFYRFRLVNTSGGSVYSNVWTTPITGK